MLDVRMPQTDGFMIFKELKKQDRKLPVLFVTAYPKSFTMKSDEMVELWTRDFIDGNTDILYKPFNVEILYEKVESLIGRTDEGET
jgi:FixJ family two-component response regulator